MIKIVYSCNDKYFVGLFLSILSIAKRCKQQIYFYILTGNFLDLNKSYSALSNRHYLLLNKLVKKYNKNSYCQIINCEKNALKYLTNKKNLFNKKFSPYASLRLLLDLYPILDKKIIYLDIDTMACGNIEELFNIDITNYEFAAANNWWLRRILSKNTINTGVLLINMLQARTTNLFSEARNVFNSKRLFWPDQTSINKAKTKFLLFPDDQYRFNRQSKRLYPNDIIKHFCAGPWGWPISNNIKQWETDKVHKYLKIFCFDEDFAIYRKFICN